MTLRSPRADILEAAIKTFNKGDFPTLSRIDSGAEATTYKGRSAIYGDVCVKCFHTKTVLAQGSKKEVQSLLKHSFHPNIVRVLGFYEENINSKDQVGYVMEFMAGGSLHSAIYSGEDYLEKDAYNWIIQAARGLQYLHEANIIHRDVKPNNMLLDKQRETLKLSDFGLAKDLESLTVAKTEGTLPYMAPELISQGGKAFGTASDVYALGISMLEIFQRQPPYGKQPELGLFPKVTAGERPIINGNMDPDVAQLLRRAWNADLGTRCTIMDIVAFANGKLDEHLESSIAADKGNHAAPDAITGIIEQSPDTQMYTVPSNRSYPATMKDIVEEVYKPEINETYIEQTPDTTLVEWIEKMFITPPPDCPDLPTICILEKTKPDDSYGFNLNKVEGCGIFLIKSLDPGGIAERAGLVIGQLIVGINGTIVYPDISHKELVTLVKQFPLSVTFLLASKEIEQWHNKHNQRFSFDKAQRISQPMTQPSPSFVSNRKKIWSALENIKLSTAQIMIKDRIKEAYRQFKSEQDSSIEQSPDALVEPTSTTPPPDDIDCPLPILCVIKKFYPSDEIGFNLHAERSRGSFIGLVDAGGIGDRAGLRFGQRLVGVNGTILNKGTPHKDVVNMIRKNPQTTLLVASEDVAQWYQKHNMSFSFDRALNAQPSKHLASDASTANVPQDDKSTMMLSTKALEMAEGKTTIDEQKDYSIFLMAMSLTIPPTSLNHYLDTLKSFISKCAEDFAYFERDGKTPVINMRRQWVGRSDGTMDVNVLKKITREIDQEKLDKEADFGAHLDYSNYAIVLYCNPKKFTAATKKKLDFINDFPDLLDRSCKYAEVISAGIYQEKPQMNCLIVGDTINAEKFYKILDGAVPVETRTLYQQKFHILNTPKSRNIMESGGLVVEKILRIGEVQSILLLLDASQTYGPFNSPCWERLINSSVPILCYKSQNDKKTEYGDYLQETFFHCAPDVIYNGDTPSSVSIEDAQRILYMAYAESIIVFRARERNPPDQ